MVITYPENKGIRCQVADFAAVFDPEKNVSASLILRTETPLPIPDGVPNEIVGAGEYEISGVKVRGVQLLKDSNEKAIKTAYSLSMDDIRVCFLGNIKSELDENALDVLGEPDVLFIGTGSKEFGAKQIASLIKQMEPKIVIPTDQNDIAGLSRELGQKPEKMEKLVIKKKDIEGMNSKLIVIQP